MIDLYTGRIILSVISKQRFVQLTVLPNYYKTTRIKTELLRNSAKIFLDHTSTVFEPYTTSSLMITYVSGILCLVGILWFCVLWWCFLPKPWGKSKFSSQRTHTQIISCVVYERFHIDISIRFSCGPSCSECARLFQQTRATGKTVRDINVKSFVNNARENFSVGSFRRKFGFALWFRQKTPPKYTKS